MGRVIHSTQYTSAEELLDKKVVVVGACTSGSHSSLPGDTCIGACIN